MSDIDFYELVKTFIDKGYFSDINKQNALLVLLDALEKDGALEDGDFRKLYDYWWSDFERRNYGQPT